MLTHLFFNTIHAFLTSTPTQYFTHQSLLACANNSLKAGLNFFSKENNQFLLTVGVCTPCLFPIPPLHDETTHKDKHMS
jgi:hypothetical protein